MKKFLIIVVGFIGMVGFGQQNKLLFNYDTAGNQITRSLCVNCPATSGRGTNPNAIPPEKTPEIEIVVLDKVTFYPNPVQEELNVQWELTNDKTVDNITIYNLNGVLMQTYSDLQKETLKVLPFGGYPSGMYIVNLNYSDGERKSLQIVKK